MKVTNIIMSQREGIKHNLGSEGYGLPFKGSCKNFCDLFSSCGL